MASSKEYTKWLINEMISTLKPFKVSDINSFLPASEQGDLEDLEDNHPLTITKVKDRQLGVSTFSLIATITLCFCGDRLVWMYDEDGYITGVAWYTEDLNG